MIKRIIFDIDGTLIRPIKFRPAKEKTLEDFGLLTEENYEDFTRGITTYEQNYDNYNRADYIKHVNSCMKNKLPDSFLDSLFKHLKNETPENVKTVKTIEYLSSKYDLVLLSNFFEGSQRGRLETLGINKYFKEYYGEKKIKPNREVYIEACGQYKPEECVMIGDNLKLDIEPAKEQGLNVIWITDQKGHSNYPKISDIEELKELL